MYQVIIKSKHSHLVVAAFKPTDSIDAYHFERELKQRICDDYVADITECSYSEKEIDENVNY